MNTADTIEWIWTGVAAIGLIAALVVFWISLVDLDAIRHNPDLSPRDRADQMLVGKANRRNQGVSAWLQALFLVVGIRALLLPSNPGSTELGTLVIQLMFISGAGLLTWTSVMTLADRMRFDSWNKHEEPGTHE